MCLGPIWMQINCVTSGNCWKPEKHFRFSAVLHYEYEADHIHLSRGAASQRAFSAITTTLPISWARRRTKTVPASHCSAPIIAGASGCTAATQCHLVWLCIAKVTVQVMHWAECGSSQSKNRFIPDICCQLYGPFLMHEYWLNLLDHIDQILSNCYDSAVFKEVVAR